MRKILTLALLLCTGAIGYAQLLNVGSIQKVDLPANALPAMSTMSPDGNYVLVTDIQKAGISKYDFATSKFSEIVKSGYDAQILDDCSTVVYREVSVGNDRLRRVAVKSTNIATGRTATLVAPTRNLQGFEVNSHTVLAVDNKRAVVKTFNSAKAVARPVASINKGQLCITVNGKTRVISPNGREGQSYLWPSVSPDGKKVVYYLGATGCFVANIDGSNPVALGSLRAARWYDNNVVVGMKDEDNGQFVTSSKIVAVTADGKTRQDLTSEASLGMYPSVAGNGSKISFTTPKGELYIINITK